MASFREVGFFSLFEDEMQIFLAGIMHGSHVGAAMHHQGYREKYKQLLLEHLPEASVYDPLADHQQSIDYPDDQGREVFMHHNRMCGETDVLIAFIPEASMGTAIEMWEAHQHNRVVITISPLVHNWAVRFLSDIVYSDEEDFVRELEEGKLGENIDLLRNQKA